MPDFLGFQYRVILDLYRILFHAVVIFGPNYDFIFNSASTYCAQKCISQDCSHTTQNSYNKWTKILTLETTIFGLKMIVRSGLEFFYFRIQRPLLPARPIQPFWAKFFCTGQQQLCSFNSKMKNSRPLFTITFEHGLRTPNEGINQRYLKNWADVADKISFGRT